MSSHSGSGRKAIWAKRKKKESSASFLKVSLTVLSSLVFLKWGFYLSTPERRESFKGIGMGGCQSCRILKNFYLEETPTFLSFMCLLWDRADENHRVLNTRVWASFTFLV